jgi:hypothetical protein
MLAIKIFLFFCIWWSGGKFFRSAKTSKENDDTLEAFCALIYIALPIFIGYMLMHM